MRTVLKSKIHRGYVTSTGLDYVGSVEIDRALMQKCDLWEYEQVVICNVNNGNRWETYVLPAEYGSGIIAVQGPGARLCEPGDIVVILAYEVTDEPIEPKQILVDENNRFTDYLRAKYEQRV